MIADCATFNSMNGHLATVLRAHSMKSADLASRLGVNKCLVSRWNKRGTPIERAIEIERVVGIPRYAVRPDYFLPSPQQEQGK